MYLCKHPNVSVLHTDIFVLHTDATCFFFSNTHLMNLDKLFVRDATKISNKHLTKVYNIIAAKFLPKLSRNSARKISETDIAKLSNKLLSKLYNKHTTEASNTLTNDHADYYSISFFFGPKKKINVLKISKVTSKREVEHSQQISHILIVYVYSLGTQSDLWQTHCVFSRMF